MAETIVDGYDQRTGTYEQFQGFHALEPLLIAEVSPRRPVAADMLLGHDRVRNAQVVKQADVLMLHYLVTEEVAPGSLEPNLDFYEPRTAHGSTLWPAVFTPRCSPAPAASSRRSNCSGSLPGSIWTTSATRQRAGCTSRRWAASGARSRLVLRACDRRVTRSPPIQCSHLVGTRSTCASSSAAAGCSSGSAKVRSSER